MKKERTEKTSFSAIKRLLKETKPLSVHLVLAALFSFFQAMAQVGIPIFVGKAIDCIASPAGVDLKGVGYWLAMLFGLILLGACFWWLSGVCITKVTHDTVFSIRRKFFSHVNKLPIFFTDTTPHGEIVQRAIGDADLVADGLLHGFTSIISGVVTILGTLVMMFLENVNIALIVVLLTPVSLLVSIVIARFAKKSFSEQSKNRGEYAGHTEEYLAGAKTVALYGMENGTQKSLGFVNAKMKKSGTRSQFFSSIANPSIRFVNGLIYAGVGIFGALSIITDPKTTLTVGVLTAFLLFANQYSKPFNEISGVLTEIQMALASARRIFAVLDEEPEIADDGLPSLASVSGDIQLESVSFSYDKSVKLIENLSLDIMRGERVAIVGPTGSGKTTIINLLMRFYDVDSGKITVDNTNINEVTRKSLRSQYGMVLQDTWVFTGTVHENIAYGKEHATREEVINASREARAHEFIEKLADGYDTVISDTGTGLSEGQRQLISIARIMLTTPPLLILDEATASIDTRTEMLIQDAFTRIMHGDADKNSGGGGGRTSFIVAHRLSTIVNADKILVLNNGKIEEIGNHAELIAKKGFYHKLYNSQFET